MVLRKASQSIGKTAQNQGSSPDHGEQSSVWSVLLAGKLTDSAPNSQCLVQTISIWYQCLVQTVRIWQTISVWVQKTDSNLWNKVGALATSQRCDTNMCS
jgi:hypothetical protein